MLTITIPGDENWDEETEQFITVGDIVLDFEHSLVALSKWEQIWEKPFLGLKEPTTEEVMAYMEAMIMTPNPPPDALDRLSQENVIQINEYINSKMTATWFSEQRNMPRSREVITNELIYYWMTVYNIPMECQNWHLNRLFTQIKVANLKQEKPKKMGKSEVLRNQRTLNEQRKAQLKSRG